MLQRMEASSRGRDEGCNELGLAGLASKLCWWWVGLKRLGVGESTVESADWGLGSHKRKWDGASETLEAWIAGVPSSPGEGQGSQEGTAAPGHVQHRGARWTIQPGREH